MKLLEIKMYKMRETSKKQNRRITWGWRSGKELTIEGGEGVGLEYSVLDRPFEELRAEEWLANSQQKQKWLMMTLEIQVEADHLRPCRQLLFT